MLGSSRRVVATILCLLTGSALVAIPHVADAKPPAPPAAWSGRPTGLGGIADYAHGEWIWQDFVYDDGGNTPQVGDGGKGNNAADIVETRVRRDGDDLAVRVMLNSMFPSRDFVLGVGWSHGDAGPSRPWPFGAGVSSPWSEFVTVTNDAVVRTAADGTTSALAAPLVDAKEQTIEFRLPGAATGPVRLVAGAGIWDPATAAGAWSSDGVLDLAFNAHSVEPFGDHSFRDTAQSAAIAGGDVSAFSTDVSVDDLDRGRTDPPVLGAGLYDRVFRGIQDLGGGYGTGCPEFKGRYQPYAFFIPSGADTDTTTPRPLALVLHSLSNVNNEFSMLHLYDQIAGERGAFAATPLARGKDCWYLNEGLVDAFDVWHDVLANYPIDAERVTLTGYSMGGYGSYRLSEFQPDRIAAAAIFAGVPAYEIWAYPLDPVPTGHPQGNTYFQLENERYIPFLIAHGTNDELVPYEGVLHQSERFRDLGFEYRFNTYPLSEHLGSFQGMDDWAQWRDWLGSRRRVTRPGEVTFKVRPDAWTDPFRTSDDRQRMLGQIRSLGFDLTSAYWVHDVHVVGAGDAIGSVDLVSHGVQLRTPVTSDVTSVTPGHPYLFGAPAQLGPPWGFATRGQDRTFTAAPVENALSGTLSGVGSLTVDLRAAGLSLDGLRMDVTVDQPVTLTLRDGRSSRVVTVYPAPTAVPSAI